MQPQVTYPIRSTVASSSTAGSEGVAITDAGLALLIGPETGLRDSDYATDPQPCPAPLETGARASNLGVRSCPERFMTLPLETLR